MLRHAGGQLALVATFCHPKDVEIPQRKGNMHTDLILFIAFIGIFLVGFAAGRWEKRDSYVRGYKRGKLVGSALVARNDR